MIFTFFILVIFLRKSFWALFSMVKKKAKWGKVKTGNRRKKELRDTWSKCELEPAIKQNIQNTQNQPRAPSKECTLKIFLPATGSHWGFQAVWVSYHFVQNTNYLLKLWPFTAFLLPTIQHQLVQSCWAIHGCWQTIAFFDCFYNLVANIVNHFSSRNI